jgi:hypothetical protein
MDQGLLGGSKDVDDRVNRFGDAGVGATQLSGRPIVGLVAIPLNPNAVNKLVLLLSYNQFELCHHLGRSDVRCCT